MIYSVWEILAAEKKVSSARANLEREIQAAARARAEYIAALSRMRAARAKLATAENNLQKMQKGERIEP